MNVDSVLKKEGITVITELDPAQVNSISKSISSKLCLAFPEHNFNRNDLFNSFSKLNMYMADMGLDSAGAKYYYKNNSIYFNDNMQIDDFSDIAIHECLHFVQEVRDEHDNVVRMGLYDAISGLGINEATVQLMASEANMADIKEEKYFGIELNTISPDYYPLECSLVKQITYFTGTYPLYHSTLYSNDIFKNTFINKTNKRTYKNVIKNLDLLLKAGNELQYFTSELQYAEIPSTIRMLHALSRKRKETIVSMYFKTQNIIMKEFFTGEFNSIRSIEDISAFKEKLYDYKNHIGSQESYTFYNNFYIEMMDLLEKKRAYIEKNGEINLFEVTANNSLMIVDNTKDAFAFLTTFIKKVRKLTKMNRTGATVNVNELY